jgi:hypothetical protein
VEGPALRAWVDADDHAVAMLFEHPGTRRE